MSHNQPGPYGGQPQQPGPYGQPAAAAAGPAARLRLPPAGSPGSSRLRLPPAGSPGRPPPAARPALRPAAGRTASSPYPAVPQPPASGGGGKKIGLILGAVAVVAAIGVGAYFVHRRERGRRHRGRRPAQAGYAGDGAQRVQEETPAAATPAEDDDARTPRRRRQERQGRQPLHRWTRRRDPQTHPLAQKLAFTFAGVYGEIAGPREGPGRDVRQDGEGRSLGKTDDDGKASWSATPRRPTPTRAPS